MKMNSTFTLRQFIRNVLLKEYYSTRESLSSKVVPIVIELLKSNIQAINDSPVTMIGGGQVPMKVTTLSLPAAESGLDFDIKVDLKVIKQPNDKLNTGGGYSIGGGIRISLFLMSQTGDFEPKHLRLLQADLYDVLRHEIEHSADDPKTQMSAITAGANLAAEPTKIEYTLKYYTNPDEVNAFVSGLYNQAKKQRRPFSEVVDSTIGGILKNLQRAAKKLTGVKQKNFNNKIIPTCETIRKTWLEHANKKYPRAIINPPSSALTQLMADHEQLMANPPEAATVAAPTAKRRKL